MKGSSYYLLRVWRWVRIPVMSAVIIVMVLYFLMWMHANSDCGYSSRTISPKQGTFDVVVEGECCDWGCIDTVKLRRRDGWGSDTKIFVYNPNLGPDGTHDPVVVWLSPNELEIAVDSVSHIHSQLGQARGVRITYRIGSVDHP
jgi:hypothetical protein